MAKRVLSSTISSSSSSTPSTMILSSSAWSMPSTVTPTASRISRSSSGLALLLAILCSLILLIFLTSLNLMSSLLNASSVRGATMLSLKDDAVHIPSQVTSNFMKSLTPFLMNFKPSTSPTLLHASETSCENSFATPLFGCSSSAAYFGIIVKTVTSLTRFIMMRFFKHLTPLSMTLYSTSMSMFSTCTTRNCSVPPKPTNCATLVTPSPNACLTSASGSTDRKTVTGRIEVSVSSCPKKAQSSVILLRKRIFVALSSMHLVTTHSLTTLRRPSISLSHSLAMTFDSRTFLQTLRLSNCRLSPARPIKLSIVHILTHRLLSSPNLRRHLKM
mmetsp:Transcript_16552/g.30948  ORF Transcript_16552/g.30948 Transcript_16552/m.30948 type:complete len:331 (-) Transcript_16552:434-1426(-)